MGHHHGEHALQPLGGAGEIALLYGGESFSSVDVVHTGHGDAVVVPAEYDVAVAHDAPAQAVFLQSCQLVGSGRAFFVVVVFGAVDEEVVVAHDAHHALFGLQAAQGGDEGFYFVERSRGEIAREADDVGLFAVDGVHDAVERFGAFEVGVHVEVGDVDDAHPGEGPGQCSVAEADAVHLIAVAAEIVTVSEEGPEEEHQCQRGPSEGRVVNAPSGQLADDPRHNPDAMHGHRENDSGGHGMKYDGAPPHIESLCFRFCLQR